MYCIVFSFYWKKALLTERNKWNELIVKPCVNFSVRDLLATPLAKIINCSLRRGKSKLNIVLYCIFVKYTVDKPQQLQSMQDSISNVNIAKRLE